MGEIGHENRLAPCNKATKELARKVAERLPEGALVIRNGATANSFHAVHQVNGTVKAVDVDLEGLKVKFDGKSLFERVKQVRKSL